MGGGGEDPARLMPEFVQRSSVAGVSTTAGTIGFTYPTQDIRADDLFLAVIAVNDRGASANVADTASGWTRIDEQLHSELALAVFYKRADGTETGAVTPFTWSSGDATNDVALCAMFQFRYVDWENGGPVVGSTSKTTGDLTSLNLPSVTTQGQNGLAVSAFGYSDNVTQSTTHSGESGGTWIAPRDPENSSSADDVALNLRIAQMETEGTISGGTVSIVPSTPQSSRSAAIGFALRGMVDDGTTTTVNSSVAASADDARETVATTVVTINTTTLFVQSATMSALRFTGLSEIKGKTIVQANLQLTATATEGLQNNGSWTIQSEAADTPAQFQAVNADISGRALSTATRSWTLPSWTANDRTLRQRSPDISAVVQEASDRAGFGGVVVLVIKNAGGGLARTFAAQDHATLQEATLTVRYTT